MAAVNYKLIKNFFTKEELIILNKYCYNKLDYSKDYVIDSQSFSPAWYNDPLMNGLLDLKLPIVERESNLNLFPTYAYWRYYVFGATLTKHTDRPACEISITACIKKYDNWRIVVEGTEFELEEGDGVLYAGCDQKHWRPGIYKGEGMAQVFFHYVNQNGPHKHHAYDLVNKNSK
jgi:alkylated DNA repair dioxygenase AlkB